jgi:hypothetical protein
MMTRNVRMFSGVLIAAGLLTAFVAAQGPAPRGMVLTGTIKSADGKALEGVTVSARLEGRTFTTSVFTNAAGAYTFPSMAAGKYKVWAQAVGFDAARADVDVSAGRAAGRYDLTMRPLERFDAQLTGEEWLASLPEATAADRRMKGVYVNNCTSCHQNGIALQNTFDAAGWDVIVDLMSRTGGLGGYSANRVSYPLIQEYRKELVEFLTRHRGPRGRRARPPRRSSWSTTCRPVRPRTISLSTTAPIGRRARRPRSRDARHTTWRSRRTATCGSPIRRTRSGRSVWSM